jgi:hypothetical protein
MGISGLKILLQNIVSTYKKVFHEKEGPNSSHLYPKEFL